MENLRSQTTFVAGIHGSGKGRLCKQISTHNGSFHVTASSLIKRGASLGPHKRVEDAVENQQILIKEHQKLCHLQDRVLLDGHFCLLNSDGEIKRLPVDVFRALKVSKVILVICQPNSVYRRLIERDGTAHDQTINEIKEFQNQEIEHARFVTDTLDLPMLTVDSEQEDRASTVLEFLGS